MEKLFFTIEKVDNSIVDLFFDSPEDTKAAYRAIKDHLGDNSSGILLIAKPRYAIILDKIQGGWHIWLEDMWKFINYSFTETGEKCYLEVADGKLVPRISEYLPATREASSSNLPMVI